MSGRVARELPKIDIGGTMFYLDLRLNEFRQCENFMNRISIDEMYETESGYKVLFDSSTLSSFRGDGEEYHARIGKDVVEVDLPSLQKMDPDGFKWLLEEWEERNPIAVHVLNGLADRESNTQAIGEVIKKQMPLLEKRRVRNNKHRGKRL